MPYRLALGALAAIALLAPCAIAQETAEDIVERAIKARCEKADLFDKQKVMVISMDGTVYNGKGEIPATSEMKYDGPTRFRWDEELSMPEGANRVVKKRITMTLSAGTAWQQMSGTPPEVQPFSHRDEFQMEVYGRWFWSLVPLRDKGLKVTKMPDSIVGNEAVWVIKATRRRYPDVNLSFSKKTSQLLKITYRAREQGVEVRKEHHFSDYKSFDGLMLPTKLIDIRDDGDNNFKAGEWNIKDYKFPDKLSDEIFAVPEKK